MDPVWTLFSRRTFSRLAHWLSALGYNLRDRSIANRIYLVYFCAFWSVWGIAVFALLGSGLAGVLNETQIYSPPPQAVVSLGAYTLIVWALVTFWQVSRRSPFIFSEEDAYLLCQTPVNRRKVGLVWFLGGILGAFIPFAAATIILSFALVEWRLQGEVTILLLFEYLKASLRALILVMPIQMGLQAALWGLGASRLQHRNEPVWLPAVFFAAVITFLAGFLFPGLHALLVAPLSLPLKAAFVEGVSMANRLASLGLGLLYLAAGLAFLFVQSRKINLSRAAQETSHVAAVGLARSYGLFELVDSINLRRRLGTTRSPSRLLARPAGEALFWKDLLQSLRALRLRELFNLAWIFGLSLGMFTASNWALQMVLAGVWAINVGALSTRRLRSDLARWWLLRTLPLRPEDLLKDEILLSWGMYALVSWSALAVSNLAILFRLYAAVLLPMLVASAALAAAQDILRQSKARILMSPSLSEENVPRQNIWGVFQGLVSVLIPFGILIWSAAAPGLPVWGAAAVPLAAFIAWLNRRAVLASLRWIE